MVEFHQLVQEISWVQESVTPKRTPSQMPTPMVSLLKPICPPHPWWGDINILNGFDVTERTRVCGKNGNFQCSKGNNSKSMQSRVTVPVLCMSPHGA